MEYLEATDPAGTSSLFKLVVRQIPTSGEQPYRSWEPLFLCFAIQYLLKNSEESPAFRRRFVTEANREILLYLQSNLPTLTTLSTATAIIFRRSVESVLFKTSGPTETVEVRRLKAYMCEFGSYLIQEACSGIPLPVNFKSLSTYRLGEVLQGKK